MKNGRYENEEIGGSHDHVIWYLNDQPHREDGPAVELSDGSMQWWFNGKCHREDGPALEFTDGEKFWFIHGVEYTEEEFNQWLMKKNLNEKLNANLYPKPKIRRSKI